MARQCLECSQWNVDVAINKIHALRRFGFDDKIVEKGRVDVRLAADNEQREQSDGGDIRRILQDIESLKLEMKAITKGNKDKKEVDPAEYNNVTVEQVDVADGGITKEAAGNAFCLLFGSQ